MCDVAEKISDEDLAHGFVALEAKLFAEGSVRFAGRVLGVDGALKFAPAAADLGALVFQAGVHLGWGVAGSSGSEAKAERVGKKFFQAKNARLALSFFRPFGTCGWGDHCPSAEALGYCRKLSRKPERA